MSSEENDVQFHEMGLDDRLLKAIAALGWSKPTLIQEKAIPLALEGKDVLVRARTGSGKTAAFCIPIIQKILISKQSAVEQAVKAIILTPTKELCNQAHKNVLELASCCSRQVKCVDVSGVATLDTQRPLLMENPDIVIGTPSRILSHLKAQNLQVKDTLEMLVIDEADVVFSFGYEDDVKQLLSYMPTIYQAFLMSATLSEDVKSMKKLVLHNPVILKLEESQLPDASQLTQYQITCEEDDKFAVLYTLFKLRLINGKTLIFTNSVDKCYKVKLFLEQFGIRACVLNSELPVNSRCHIVEEFNGGSYDIIIASDELTAINPTNDEAEPEIVEKKTKKGKEPRQKRKRKSDKESGVSRGIDFQNVSNVVNFDFPTSLEAYIHRVGRTARGENKGSALSFVSAREMKLLESVEKSFKEENPGAEQIFQPYSFQMKDIQGFQYRAKDALRAVTSYAVKEARLKEIRKEILNSDKLKSYFEENPRDLQLLRHDKDLHTVTHQPHLKNVPDYIVPPTLRHMKAGRRKGSGGHGYNPSSSGYSKQKQKYNKRKADPLKSLEFTGIKTKKAKKKKVPTATLR